MYDTPETSGACEECLPGKPVVTVKSNGNLTDGANVEFSWTSAIRADYYEFYIEYADNMERAFVDWGVTGTSYSKAIEAGEYYVRVVSINNALLNAKQSCYWNSSERVRFTVKASPKTYTISYNANGGTGAPSSQTKTNGVNISLSAKTPTRSGYTFLGWATSDSGSVEYNAGSNYTSNSSATLYAVWKSNSSITPVKTMQYNGHTYSLYNVCVPWSVAVDFCRTQNGYLAIIESEAENKAVAEFAKNIIDTTPYIWLGGTDEEREGNWKWTNGDSFSYTNWDSGEPNNVSNVEHYLMMYADNGLWNDATISSLAYYGFICEQENSDATLFYNANGGTEPPSPLTVENGDRVTITSEKPVRSDYTFLGWSYSASASSASYNSGDRIYLDGDTTLYAVWQKKNTEIILTINSNAATVSGKTVYNDVAPIIENDRTMLPARFVAENLGATVSWDDNEKCVTIRNSGTTIQIYIGSSTAYVNGSPYYLDSPAFLRNDRTYTPVRFICESLGANVSWDEATQRVIITT